MKKQQDSNENNIFVNFQHVLLKKIIKELNDPIDRIFFTMVCKKWFLEKDNYLEFNSSQYQLRYTTLSDFGKNVKYLTKSYEKQIKSTISKKSNLTIIFDQTFNAVYDFDYFCNDEKSYLNVMNEHGPNIKTILYRRGANQDWLKDLWFYPNITEIYLYEFNESNILGKGKLPPIIKSLHILSHLQKIIEPGDFPPYLEKLYVKSFNSNDVITSEKLPSTLTYLELSSCRCKIQSLPPNLKELHFTFDYIDTIPNHILPESLHTIKGVKSIENMHLNTSIKSLKLTIEGNDLNQFYLIQFPPNAIDLYLNLPSLTHTPPPIPLPPTIDEQPFLPPNIERLSIMSCTYYTKWIMNVLKMQKEQKQHQYYQKLKYLQLHAHYICRPLSIEIDMVPNGIESLNLYRVKLEEGFVMPESVIELNQTGVSMTLDFQLPIKLKSFTVWYDSYPKHQVIDTVEHLELSHQFLHKIKVPIDHLFPNVRTLNILVEGARYFIKRLDYKYFFIMATFHNYRNLRYSGITTLSKFHNYYINTFSHH